jgi:MtrB/PioB family decaheme-associated outer membrane protein
MKSIRPLFLLGTLSAAVSSALAVDTSQWKCESCPFEKDRIDATVEAGVTTVSQESAKFGDYSGYDRKGAYLDAGGTARVRSGGFYGSVTGTDLGLDSRSFSADAGREGLFRLRLGYSQIPRHLTEGAETPFLGVGGSVLTLPGGYPAATTASMPLASTLQPVDIGYKRERYDVGATALAGQAWTYGITWRRDVRDGTRPMAGSFFSTSSQLVVPVDQVTDQFEVSTSYNGSRFQATLGGQLSVFRNNQDSLTWSNPFTALVAGGNTGQLALPPDNKFWQVFGSAGFDIMPRLRASADLAVGRMTQDDGFVAPTLNANLAPAAQAAMPGQSLNGKVDTLNGSVRVTATPIDALRLNLAYLHDERDNKTPSETYPTVITDTFVDVARTNQPFGFKQNRYKFDADYRLLPKVRTSVGAEQDDRDRTLQEVVTTRETTFWGKVGAQLREDLSLSFKYARAGRSSSTYGVAAWIDPPENPLMRKFNLAERTRNKGTLRADATVTESISIGLNVEIADDDYRRSTIGLKDARTVDFGADASWAINDATQLFVFAQTEHIRSRQTGSQVFANPDWTAHNTDRTDVAGLGVKYAALKGKLDLGADLTFARTRSDVLVSAGPTDPPFPPMKTSRDSVRLRADYRVKDNLSVSGLYGFERYNSQDWRLDGVFPGTVPNLLALGDQSPRYRVHLFSIALRYRI